VTSYYTTIDSPIGALLLCSDGDALTGLFMEPHSDQAGGAVPDEKPFRAVIEQLRAYFAGESTTFDVPLTPHGTEFQRKVWAELLTIPYGHTVSYGEIATTLGNPLSSRAVGLANGRNPISVIVPCHRVIGADGSLTGYGGGLPRKRWLLDHERATLARSGQLSGSDATTGAAIPAGLW
jgi:methylated-DNA-[protein]-cysteine S-methyltransferase